MHLSNIQPVTSENQFHCTRLYAQFHKSLKYKHAQIRSQTDRQADRQTDRQTSDVRHQMSDRQTDRQTDRQAGRHAGRQGGREGGRQAGRQAGRQTDRQTDRQADRQLLQVTELEGPVVRNVLQRWLRVATWGETLLVFRQTDRHTTRLIQPHQHMLPPRDLNYLCWQGDGEALPAVFLVVLIDDRDQLFAQGFLILAAV